MDLSSYFPRIRSEDHQWIIISFHSI
eukprot:COSAG02_NODE_15486_length_1156_cov_2.068416_2_plen_25_part_01